MDGAIQRRAKTQSDNKNKSEGRAGDEQYTLEIKALNKPESKTTRKKKAQKR